MGIQNSETQHQLLNKPSVSAINQLCNGHVPLFQDLSQQNLRADPTCVCRRGQANVQHLVFPMLNSQQAVTRTQRRTGPPRHTSHQESTPSLRDLRAHWKLQEHNLHYQKGCLEGQNLRCPQIAALRQLYPKILISRVASASDSSICDNPAGSAGS